MPAWCGPLALALLMAGFGVLVFGRCMARAFNHDEHQFLAPAALLARDGLIPYRDFPAFHLPNLTFIYAALDRLSPSLIFSTRLFSIFCSVASGALLAGVAYRLAGRTRLAVGVAAALLTLLFFDPLFRITTGKVWNHEFPSACLLVAVLAVVANVRRAGIGLALLGGLATGVAVGSRLTFAPVFVPLFAVHLLFDLPWKLRLRLAVAFAGGVFLGMLPTLWLFALSPERFLFDNFEFPRLRLLDPDDTRVRKTMTGWRKVRFFLKEIVLPGWPLYAAYLAIGLPPALRWFRERTSARLPQALILVTCFFALIGCFGPSRYQDQHFFKLVPLVTLGIAFGFRGLSDRARRGRMVLLAVLAVTGAGSEVYLGIRSEGPEAFQWVREITAPTAPFAWRAAHLLPRERRSQMQLIAPADLEAFLAKDPPAGVLTGVEADKLEKPLIAYAEKHGMRRVALGKVQSLWIP